MIRAATAFVLDHPEIIPSVYDMLEQIQTALSSEESSTSLTSVDCPEYGQYPCNATTTTSTAPYAELYDSDSTLTDTWRRLLTNIRNESKECDSCVVSGIFISLNNAKH